ncbi:MULTISPECIES: sensor histidine kinase [Niastella]|uniref:histidine kinase n=1 Tax=Niastella soli TaxID=2821487 RepID=A0ABS3YTG8_9BACT|nr:sensor histidine kinase [Niastella soli]MBO9201209.1 sensor histidine kinase [Niastella soli]
MSTNSHPRFVSANIIRRHPFRKAFKHTFFYILLFCFANNSYSQWPDSMVVEASDIRFQKAIGKQSLFTSAPKHKVPDAEIYKLPFKQVPGSYLPHVLPGKLVERDCFLQFALKNSADTAISVCFIPGSYCRSIILFKAQLHDIPGTFTRLPDSSITDDRNGGVKRIRLQPHEEAVFFSRFNFVRTNVNSLIPRLIMYDYLTQWSMIQRERDSMLDVFTYTVSGVLLFMIFYSLAVYIQSRNKEFVFYALYTFLTCSLLFLKSYLDTSANGFNYFYEEYLDFMIMTASVVVYQIFMRKFINSQDVYPVLDKILRSFNILLIGASIVFSVVYFFTDLYIMLNIMENAIKQLFFVTGVVFIVYSIKKKNPLLNYLAAGNFSLIALSVVSYIIIITGWKLVKTDATSIFNRALFYYEFGLVLELGFFLSGLAFKNRRDIIERVKERERLKLENERKEFDKQMAVMAAKQEERNRISADMHDELGSGVTAIRLMSEIMKSRLKGDVVPELEKISNSANELLGKMNTIIWTMKSSNDTLESLIAYIRAHAIEYFDSTPIECRVQLPALIPQAEVSGEKRRNIFLSIKEALNNAMKHSQASQIQIIISTNDKWLMIKICDNGVGIDADKLRRFGNGLSNMRRRMESIEGAFKIESDNNCILTFEAPI